MTIAEKLHGFAKIEIRVNVGASRFLRHRDTLPPNDLDSGRWGAQASKLDLELEHLLPVANRADESTIITDLKVKKAEPHLIFGSIVADRFPRRNN